VLEQAALELAAEIDLDGVPTCPLCLLDLAMEVRQGRQPSRALVKRTVDWVWMESGEAVRELVVRARMQERPGAEEALSDPELNGWRSDFAEAVVRRLARPGSRRSDTYSR
jgi:hypothetical protein